MWCARLLIFCLACVGFTQSSSSESSLEELLRLLNSQEYLQQRELQKKGKQHSDVGFERKFDSDSSIDLNYYYSERTVPQCGTKEGINMCKSSCRPHMGFCDTAGQCQCEVVTIGLMNKHMMISYIPSNNRPYDDDSGPLEFDEVTPSRYPTRRHHIAHFCPNIELARNCIKKCLAEGLPAFCNQEKVCYCGHLYTSHDENDEHSADAAKHEFKDLIEKYLLDPNLADTKPL